MWYSLLGLKLIAPDRFLAHVMVDGDSPWFCGHFPDNPILPGIAQLNMVAGIIAKAKGENLYIKRLSRVKFKKIVRPGELLEIHATATDVHHYTFQITHEAQDVCSGVISLAEKQ